MGLIVEFSGAKRLPVSQATMSPILVRSLSKSDIACLNQSFEKYHLKGSWQGYAVLDSVPDPLGGTIHPLRHQKRIGSALFSSGYGDLFFLFNDHRGLFHLLNSNGELKATKTHLKSLLKEFHKNILN